MATAICRCGERLEIPSNGEAKVTCPRCGARVRIRLKPTSDDAKHFIRLVCGCGQRLKVPAENPPSHVRCRDCQRVVAVPIRNAKELEVGTEELVATDHASLEQWKASHRERGSRVPRDVPPGAVTELQEADDETIHRSEAGLRVCPSCGRPIHLGASACLHCGLDVPRI